MELLTAAEMRGIEAAAIASGRVTGASLMERAGRELVAALLAEWPMLARAPHRTIVLAGPGNNGGDGYVAARLLRERGWTVAVHALGDPAALPPDASEMAARWREMGEIAPLEGVEMANADILIDALFGTGLVRPLTLDPDRFAGAARRVAVDIPSGLDADSGRVLGAALPADLTVTFHAAKLGHVLEEGPDLCGRLAVADIGLAGGGAVRTVRPDDLAKRGGHKYAHGHALILAGGVGRGGAARLAARGALRIGAGLVTVACPPAALIENAARLDAIMLRAAKGAEGVAAILADPRITTVCAGPGLGTGAETREVVHALLAAGRATVLDADALTAFAEAPETLFDAIPPGAPVVLTPHGGEFARLFPDIQAHWTAAPTPGPAPSKLDAARAAAARAGATVLLKGPDTVIAGPDGTASVAAATQHRACPWLATAGAGDVLAGLIAGLLARGFPPATAAAQAAWLHQEAAREIGPGLIAEDLPEALPAILRRLEA